MGGDVTDAIDAFEAIRFVSGREELDRFDGPLLALPRFVLGFEGDS
jgi:hypothetical protein